MDQDINSSFSNIILNYGNWPRPESKNFAEVKDPVLFQEVIEIAFKEGFVSLNKLISESGGLSRRLFNLWLVDKPTKTTIMGLLIAMKNFGWLEENSPGEYNLSKAGLIINEYASDFKLFRRKLLQEMYKRYVFPGWIISRLMTLNPKGQGQIVLPSPVKTWKPKRRLWEESGWSEDLSEQVLMASHLANKIFPGSFPVDDKIWVLQVEYNWEQISSGRRRVSRIRNNQLSLSRKPGVQSFAPRERLTQAMRDAAVDLLFSPWSTLEAVSHGAQILDLELEYGKGLYRLPPRSFRAWCPRLDSLELIIYTDYYPAISGRLIFPCAVFRKNGNYPPFEIVKGISDPQGNDLYLFQPKWDSFRNQYFQSLIEAYGIVSRRIGSLYVSLLDVRDEVCRQLRLSSTLFDEFLEYTYRESIVGESKMIEHYSISLESDIRPDQKSAYGLLRRPVYINKVPYSLIAIAYT